MDNQNYLRALKLYEDEEINQREEENLKEIEQFLNEKKGK